MLISSPLRQTEIAASSGEGKARLENTPHATNFTESYANFAKGFAACIPTIIDDGDRAAAPTSRTTASFALAFQLMQQRAASLVRASIAGVIGKM
jgi:hypothetical protein